MFRRSTRESINEAIMLYILAAKLLGIRPKSIRPQIRPPDVSYRDLYGNWDKFRNAWYSFTDSPLIKSISQSSNENTRRVVYNNQDLQVLRKQTNVLSSLGMLYFCIPNNDKLLGYWDMVEDRLFKIRNCMNIDGIVQKLPLFSPPIDPELLIRATAAGLDIATVLNDQSAPQLPYRFTMLLQKAMEQLVLRS